MNVWQSCSDTRDAVPLYPSHGLHLKPVALLHISVQLPQLKAHGKAISNWEIMEKLKVWIQPEEFTSLKVSKSTLEFIRFDAEIANKCQLLTVIGRLDGRSIKLSGFSEQLKVRAVEAKGDFPTKHDWDSFFRDAKDMNEMKAGERPDTVYLSNLPCKWFSSGVGSDKPSERLLQKIFEQFGEVRRIDIPMLDAYRNQMNNSISGVRLFTFNKSVIFEAYIQYKEYFCFVKCMDAFRGKKLVYIDESKNAFTASIKVCFDKSKHLSDVSINRRQIIRDRLIKKEKERLEKEMKEKEEEEKRKEEERRQKMERRKLREQKRKEKQLEKLKLKEMEDMNKKIAAEEYLLLMAQRKLESIRLLGELINRIKNEKEKEIASANTKRKRKRDNEKFQVEDDTLSRKTKNSAGAAELDAEKDLRYKLIQKFKKMQQRELVKEKVKLRTLVSDGLNSTKKSAEVSSVSSDSDSDVIFNKRLLADEDNDDRRYGNVFNGRQNRRYWQNNRGRRDRGYYSRSNTNSGDYQNPRGRFSRGRRGFGGRSWRGQNYPNHNQYMMPFMDPMLLTYSHEYYRYLQKIARESRHSGRSSTSRSYSRSRSRSHSSRRSRSRSWSRSRSRSRRSVTRSYSRSYSRSRSTSQRRTRSYSESRSRSRQRDVRSRSDRRESDSTAVNSKDVGVKINSHVDRGERAAAPIDDNGSACGKEKHKKNKKHKKKKKKKKSESADDVAK